MILALFALFCFLSCPFVLALCVAVFRAVMGCVVCCCVLLFGLAKCCFCVVLLFLFDRFCYLTSSCVFCLVGGLLFVLICFVLCVVA